MYLRSMSLFVVSVVLTSGMVACKSADDYKYTPPEIKVPDIDTDKLIADLEENREASDLKIQEIQELIESMDKFTAERIRKMQLEELGEDHPIIVAINADRTSMNRSAENMKSKTDIYEKAYDFATNVMNTVSDTDKDEWANEMSEKSPQYLLVYMGTFGLLKTELDGAIVDLSQFDALATAQASKENPIEKFSVYKQALLFQKNIVNQDDNNKVLRFANTVSDVELNSDIYMAIYQKFLHQSFLN